MIEEIRAVANRIRHHDVSLDSDLRDLAANDLESCVDFLRTILFSECLYMECGASCYVLEQLQKLGGKTQSEAWILQHWNTFTDDEKRRVCYGAASIEAISTDLALTLFQSNYSTLDDKQLLLAGLASTAEIRNCEATVYDLADELSSSAAKENRPNMSYLIQQIQDSFQSPSMSERARKDEDL